MTGIDIERAENGTFLMGQPAQPHGQGCSCMRCSQETRNKFGFQKGHKSNIRTRFKKGQKPWFLKNGYKIENHPNFRGNNGSIMKKILIRDIGKCETCGFNDVRALVIHHKDRNFRNNKKDNIQLLCANCHSIEHHEGDNQ